MIRFENWSVAFLVKCRITFNCTVVVLPSDSSENVLCSHFYDFVGVGWAARQTASSVE